MVNEVIVIRDTTVILENPAVDHSFLATVGVERIRVQKWRDVCWHHIHCHCYGLQLSRNDMLNTDSNISYFMMGCMAFMCVKSTKAIFTRNPNDKNIVNEAKP